MSDLTFAVIDLETTGFSPRLHDRVIEIAVVRMEPDAGILNEWSTLLNPERAVGGTEVHGLRATDVKDAPRFAEVAGDIAARLAGTVLVAHNARFDLGFLAAEFTRAGVPWPEFQAACTLRMAAALRPGLACRQLAHCCQDMGIEHQAAHCALYDARATAQLLAAYLEVARSKGIPLDRILEMDCKCARIPYPGHWCISSPTGRTLTRETSAFKVVQERGYLARLVERLPPSPFEDPDAAAYLELLDRALEDRRITEAEADALFQTASEWGLSRAKVFEAHNQYLNGLVRVALADGVVTPTERRDLDLVAQVLGLPRSSIDGALASAAPDKSQAPESATPTPKAGALAGLSVCFTGELEGSYRGAPLTRDMAELLASESGLFVRRSVTKTTDLLVAADADTQSGKAKKAHQYGIRVMAAPAFWAAIGVQVE